MKGAKLLIKAKELAQRIAFITKDKKAKDVVILDLRKVASFCDYFVIASCSSLRQVNATSDAIQQDLAKDKIKSLSKVSANDQSGWIVLDYSDVIAHIFYEPTREFYSLEHLWSDAKRVKIPRTSRLKE